MRYESLTFVIILSHDLKDISRKSRRARRNKFMRWKNFISQKRTSEEKNPRIFLPRFYHVRAFIISLRLLRRLRLIEHFAKRLMLIC